MHEELSDTRPVNARAAVHAVLALLDDHLPEGQCAKLRRALPEPLRELWPADGWDRGNGARRRGPDTYRHGGPPPREVRGYDDDWYE